MIVVRDNIIPRYDEYRIYYIIIKYFLLTEDLLEL